MTVVCSSWCNSINLKFLLALLSLSIIIDAKVQFPYLLSL